jgi:ribonuclease P protein component
VWQQGRKVPHPLLSLRALPNDLPQARVAFVVGKKVGKAVIRNRAKRLMREAMRQKFQSLIQGYDLVLIGHPPIVGASFNQVESALDELLSRARLLQSQK